MHVPVIDFSRHNPEQPATGIDEIRPARFGAGEHLQQCTRASHVD